jgi:hypothetical protein
MASTKGGPACIRQAVERGALENMQSTNFIEIFINDSQ